MTRVGQEVTEPLETASLLAVLAAHAVPGPRVTGYLDGFVGAVLTVLGQQVSVAAARTCATEHLSAGEGRR